MTRAEVSEKIARMKAVQRGLVKAVGSDYNDQRRFQVREIEVNGKVVSRLMKIDTNLKYLPSEDLFNEIYDLPYLICRERHEYIRVNFFGRCKFLQI